MKHLLQGLALLLGLIALFGLAMLVTCGWLYAWSSEAAYGRMTGAGVLTMLAAGVTCWGTLEIICARFSE